VTRLRGDLQFMMKLSDRINLILNPCMVRYVISSFRKKIKRVRKEHPDLFVPVSREVTERHVQLWGKIGVGCIEDWLRFHVNLTGIQDHTFCPEDIYFAIVERIFNDCSSPGHDVEDKNTLEHFTPIGYVPVTVMRYVRGIFFDANNCVLKPEQVDEKLKNDLGPLVGKPCIASSGGNNVELFLYQSDRYMTDSGLHLSAEFMRQKSLSYIIQKKIHQDYFSASFNPSSVNTCRMMMMRCPWDGEIVVLKTMMRLGVSSAVVDNMMKGGLCVNIGNDGIFGRYAFDYNGKRYDEHPVSRMRFSGLIHPYYRQMVECAIEITKTITNRNLLSFDLVPREDGSICVVEINATGQGITQLQFDHGGLFGEYSEKVVEWCLAHKDNAHFLHFRTFYY
jgi:hypothetical protein